MLTGPEQESLHSSSHARHVLEDSSVYRKLDN